MRASLFLALVLMMAPSSALACTLLKARSAKEADVLIYFTKFLKEDNSSGKYKRCRLVSRRQSDTKLFFVTPFRQDASVVIHRSNWPKG